MILKASSRWASKKNLSQFGPAVWAVGGGASDLGRASSCNSGTSVYSIDIPVTNVTLYGTAAKDGAVFHVLLRRKGIRHFPPLKPRRLHRSAQVIIE